MEKIRTNQSTRFFLPPRKKIIINLHWVRYSTKLHRYLRLRLFFSCFFFFFVSFSFDACVISVGREKGLARKWMCERFWYLEKEEGKKNSWCWDGGYLICFKQLLKALPRPRELRWRDEDGKMDDWWLVSWVPPWQVQPQVLGPNRPGLRCCANHRGPEFRSSRHYRYVYRWIGGKIYRVSNGLLD